MSALATLYKNDPTFWMIFLIAVASGLVTLFLLAVFVNVACFIADLIEDGAFETLNEEAPCPPISAPQSHFVSVPYSLLERRRLYSGMSEALET